MQRVSEPAGAEERADQKEEAKPDGERGERAVDRLKGEEDVPDVVLFVDRVQILEANLDRVRAVLQILQMQNLDRIALLTNADELMHTAVLLLVVQIQLVLVQDLLLFRIAHGSDPQRNVELLVKGLGFVLFLQVDGDLLGEGCKLVNGFSDLVRMST